MKRIFLFFLIILLILKIAVLSGCANIIPPTGGPRDSLPPLLIKVTPPDSSRNFSNKTITFTFDEFIEDVQQQNPYQNVMISPNPSTQPIFESKLRTLTVKLKDTLEPNTTYHIDFGDVIKDVNERNVLNNFSYIFTTGNTFDTLQLSGNVVLAETGGIDTTMVAMLFKSGDDSAIVNDRARYITKLDGKGNFRFQYLPPATYYIYAMDSRRIYSDQSFFAFIDSAVEIKPDAPPITLYAFKEKKEQQQPGATFNFAGGNRPGVKPDERRLRFSTNLSGNVQDLLGDFSLNFDRPIRNIDTTKMQLSTDSTFIPASAAWEMDSLKKKLTLKINWKENTLYNLILDKEFAEDTLGRKLLKTDTLNFTTKKLADYGSVKVSFKNIDLSQNPVLQFSQNGQVVKSFTLTTTEVYQQLINPGEYELTILYDKNKNGKWDPGQFFGEKKQPELVRPLKQKITIRANWDNEFEITL
jgi:hypothetical protein